MTSQTPAGVLQVLVGVGNPLPPTHTHCNWDQELIELNIRRGLPSSQQMQVKMCHMSSGTDVPILCGMSGSSEQHQPAALGEGGSC